MGFATILVPGGNDTLLLSALPSLAAHGAVAYLAMFGVQLSLSIIAGRWKLRNMRRGKGGTTGRSEASSLGQPEQGLRLCIQISPMKRAA